MSDAHEQPDRWWRNGVMYQIYPRSFADSDGDGTGDLPGILARLDYLNNGTPDSLGVDAIWLSPIYPSPGYDVGYDVSDYDAIDPLFGSMEDFTALVDEAHRRGVRVMLDLVMNHTSHELEWFQQSRSSRDNPKRDWYIWRKAAPGRRRPNNWLSWFGGSAWTSDPRTGEFYLHTFLREQPDLNWRNPEVPDAMLATVRRWLDRGVDGFRLDVFNTIYKHVDLPDLPMVRGGRGYARLEHIYDKNQPELFQFLTRFRALIDERPGRMSVGELFDTPGGAARYAGAAADRLHLVFDFRFLEQPWDAAAFLATIVDWDSALADGWPCYVLGNHDQSRLATRFGEGLPTDQVDAICKVAATLLLTLRGTPFIYQGEEIGMRDAEIPPGLRRDTPAIRYDFPGRDPERSPIPWSGDAPGYGFTTASETWLPFGRDAGTRNVAAQHRQPGSVLNWYRRLLWLRRSCAALNAGTWRPVATPDRAMAYLREHGAERMLVALNLAGERVAVPLDRAYVSPGSWRTRLSTHDDSSEARIAADELRLEPYEALILEHTG